MRKKTDLSEKTYNRCLTCPHRNVRCNGPRTSDLPLDRWCELMRDMKEVNGLTNAWIAETSGVSVKTIERLMAMNCDQDIRRETARMIEMAIMGSERKYPCYLAFAEENAPAEQKLNDAMRDLERALDDNKDYRVALDNIHASHRAEMETVRAEAQRKIDYLLDLVAKLRADNDNLWAENNRKSKIVDMFIAKQNV